MATYADVIILKDGVSRTLEDVLNGLDKVDRKTTSLQTKMSKLGNSMKSFGRSASLYVTAPLAALGVGVVKAASEMEDTQAMFETMLGSAQKAGDMISKIQKMAAETPMTSRTLNESAKLLLNFNYAQEKILPTMKMLGDISGGNEQRFRQLTLAFAQVQSAGRLMGQDLLQMINTGFNPLQIIAEKTGETMAEVKDRMSEGGVSVQEVEEAMISATSAGGRFFNLMEKRSQTTSGRISTLADNLNILAVSLGEHVLPFVNQVVEKLIKLVDWFGKLSPATQKTILIVGGLVAILPPLIIGIGSVITALSVLAASPIILKIAAIIGVVSTLGKVFYEIGQIIGSVVAWIVQGFSKLMGWLERVFSKFSSMKSMISILNPIIGAVNAGKAVANFITGDSAEKTKSTIANSQSTPIPQNNNTSITNTINNSGNVREEADIDKVGAAIVEKLQMTMINQGNYRS